MNNNRATFFFSGYRWIITGIVSGLIFYLFFGAIIPQLFDDPIVERSVLFGLVYWSLFGIGFTGLTKIGLEIGYKGKRWIVQGVLWGFSMFILTNLAVPYFGGEEITLAGILVRLIVFSVVGLGYGYVMKLYMAEIHTSEESI